MRKKKQKADSVLKVVAIMKFTRVMNCSFKEAASMLKKMNKQV